LAVNWLREKTKANSEELKKVMDALQDLFKENSSGVFLVEELSSLKSLEDKNKHLLDLEEVEWKLKSRAIWLVEGDNNTNFFHKFASHKKNYNTILELVGSDGVSSLV
jgi:hypothetical protein